MKVEELKQLLITKQGEARNLLNEDKLTDAEAKMQEVRDLKSKIKIAEELEQEEKRDLENQKKDVETREDDIKMEKRENKTAMELRAIIKASMGKEINAEERALLVGGSNGEGYILPQDVKTKIVELIRQYKSFRDVVGYLPTTALSGSFPIEAYETVSELIDFTDGTPGNEADDIKFKNISFALKEKGALIKLSNTLLTMTDNDLINYVSRVFAKKAMLTENKMAIESLKKGKTVKAVADWKALKKSINVDLDEAIKYGTVIVTNQDGFDMLDSALDSTGRPVLQPNPQNATQKLFMGYPVVVYSNALLPTTGSTNKKAPIFYGNLGEAVKFVDNGKYSFATSSEAGFTSNTTYARVIEYIDCIQIDSSDKIYIAGEISITA